MLEEQDQHTPMMLPEGIKREKGEGAKADKRFIPLIEASSEDLYINKEGDTMEWLQKWHHRDLQKKEHLRNDQEFIMGDVLELQASIERGGIDLGGKDQVVTIWEGICLAKRIAKQGLKEALQAKEQM